MDNMAEEVETRVLARVLNAIAWKRDSGDTFRNYSSAVRNVPNGGLRLRLRRLFPEEDDDAQQEERQTPQPNPQPNPQRRNLVPVPASRRAIWPRDVRDSITFPWWFPFPDNKYEDGEQVSNEVLYINERSVNQFQCLENYQLTWIYGEFFRYMHWEARKAKNRGVRKMLGVSNTLKYEQFMPPWIRMEMVIGDCGDIRKQVSAFLEEACVPCLRVQRNNFGCRRLIYLLGAFFEKQEEFAHAALRHLLQICPNVDDGGKKQNKTSNESEPTPTAGLSVAMRREVVNSTASQGQHGRENTITSLDEPTYRRHFRSGDELISPQRTPTNSHLRSRGPMHSNMAHVFEHSDVDHRIVDGRNQGRTVRIGSQEYHEGFTERNDTRRPRSHLESTPHSRARRIPMETIDLDAENATSGQDRSSNTERQRATHKRGLHEAGPASSPRSKLGDRLDEEFPAPPVPEHLRANGLQCRFTGHFADSVFNGPGAITGRCKGCRHALHDLCGGGEDGAMICNQCLKQRRRRQISLS